MISLVTFSDESMGRSASICVDSALKHGVGLHWFYTPEIIQRFQTVRDNPEVFRQPEDPRRAYAHWAFKPLIISEALGELPDGYLIYSDAGIEFIGDVGHIMNYMDQDVFLFGNNWEHAHWCKRDVVEAVLPFQIKTDHLELENTIPWMRFGKQCQASVIFFRVSDYSRAFVKEWLDWCLSGVRIGAAVSFGKDNPEHRDERMTWSEFRYLIDDSPSVFPNHPEFREHRHDQAILTTMAYREGIKLHYWPASYNDGAFVYEKLPEYAGDDYPILFNHHRRRNHEWASAA